MEYHQLYMQRCLHLAEKGFGKVAPNPMVGSVVVHQGQVVGEGYHQQFGQAHAEVNAIRCVADPAVLRESTLYVSLEPCTHYGKTPPCADLILEKGIPRVVVASHDPNPLIAGRGIAKLKAAGVEVVTGVLQKQADFLNRRFITYHTKKWPYIILKWAQSADGIMAPAEPKQLWLTNELSKKLVHRWRSQEQAILVGRNTLEIDDPLLTVRLVEGPNPVRIVLGKQLPSMQRKMFADAGPVWVFNSEKEAQVGEVNYIKLDDTKTVLPQVLEHLWQHTIQSVIVEGGPVTLQHFIAANLWDEARVFTTQHVLGEGKKSPLINGVEISSEAIETDKLVVYTNTGG